jgi:phosphoribosylamine-glycine ligase
MSDLNEVTDVVVVQVVPGNAGIKNGKISSTLDSIPISAEHDFKELIGVAKNMNINLVIPGSEAYINNGMDHQFSKGNQNFPDSVTALLSIC